MAKFNEEDIPSWSRCTFEKMIRSTFVPSVPQETESVKGRMLSEIIRRGNIMQPESKYLAFCKDLNQKWLDGEDVEEDMWTLYNSHLSYLTLNTSDCVNLSYSEPVSMTTMKIHGKSVKEITDEADRLRDIEAKKICEEIGIPWRLPETAIAAK